MRVISLTQSVCLAVLIVPPVLADAERAKALDAMGIYDSDRGRFADAEARLEEALLEWRQYLGPDHIALVRVVTRLAGVYIEAGDLAKAERLDLPGWLDRLRREAPDGRELVPLLQALGALDSQRGRFELARTRFEEALSRSSADSRAATLNDFGLACLRAGQLEAAIEHLSAARLLWNELRGAESVPAGVTAFNLALAYQAAGRYPEAEFRMRESLSISAARLGPDSFRTGGVLAAFARLLRQMNRKAEANRISARAERILRGRPTPYVVDVTQLALRAR